MSSLKIYWFSFFLRERQWHREGDASLGIEQPDLGQPFDLMAAHIAANIPEMLPQRFW